jgi:hypothetical protein
MGLSQILQQEAIDAIHHTRSRKVLLELFKRDRGIGGKTDPGLHLIVSEAQRIRFFPYEYLLHRRAWPVTGKLPSTTAPPRPTYAPTVGFRKPPLAGMFLEHMCFLALKR